MSKKLSHLFSIIIFLSIIVFSCYTYYTIDKKGEIILEEASVIINSVNIEGAKHLGKTVSADMGSKKASFAFLGGTINAFELDIQESKFVTIKIEKTLGDCKVLFVDRHTSEIVCEIADEGIMKVALQNKIYDVIVVGDLFLGNIKVVWEDL